MSGKFEIYQDKAGEYRFRLKATNGQIILASEGYSAKAGCTNGVASVKTNATIEARYQKKQTVSGKYMFNLLAANHQVIGTSEAYETATACNNGIASVMNNAPNASVVELV